MEYRALYRKYRPATFAEVVGQGHITTTLQNQIAAGHVAHAYLFCGTRGTGKTSTAKIFARAVNCLSPDHGEPCGTCDACRAVARPRLNPDIVEIDAASNTGVDDVRALIEKAHYAPLQLRRRACSSSTRRTCSPSSAFNALLKTLEEPPAHILFILATTEPQKLPGHHRLPLPAVRLSTACPSSDIAATLQGRARARRRVHRRGGPAAHRPHGRRRHARRAVARRPVPRLLRRQASRARDVYDVLGSMEQGFLFDMAGALLAARRRRARCTCSTASCAAGAT